jgi:hypothetical protein
MRIAESRTRHMAAAIVIACGVAVMTWTLRHGEATATIPSACTGLLDALAAALGRAAPNAPLGRWLLNANDWLRAAAIGALVILVRRWSRGWTVAIAVALTIALSPAAAVAYSALEPAALLVAAITFLALSRAADRRVWRVVAYGGLLVMALIEPQSALLIAAIAAALALTDRTIQRARWRAALIIAAAVGAIGVLAPLAFPHLPASIIGGANPCRVLFAPARTGEWLRQLTTMLSAAGVYAIGLAALGGFAVARGVNWRGPLSWILLAFAIVPTFAAQADAPVLRSLSSALAAYSILIAIGLSELVAATGRGPGGRLGSALLVAVLPVLAYAGLTADPAIRESFGLETMSARDFNQLLSVLPDDSVLVGEDASAATLLRSLDGAWQHMGKRLEIAGPDERAIVRALSDPARYVFALPPAQRELSWLGWRLQDARLPRVTGLAAVTAGGGCAPVPAHWTTVSAVGAANAHVMTVATRDFGAAHGIVIYVAMRDARHPEAMGGETSGRTGLHEDIYTRANTADQDMLDDLLHNDHVPPALSDGLGPVVARIEVWREAGVPKILPLDLGSVPISLVLRGGGTAGGDRICPGFPYEAAPLQIQR